MSTVHTDPPRAPARLVEGFAAIGVATVQRKSGLRAPHSSNCLVFAMALTATSTTYGTRSSDGRPCPRAILALEPCATSRQPVAAAMRCASARPSADSASPPNSSTIPAPRRSMRRHERG